MSDRSVNGRRRRHGHKLDDFETTGIDDRNQYGGNKMKVWEVKPLGILLALGITERVLYLRAVTKTVNQPNCTLPSCNLEAMTQAIGQQAHPRENALLDATPLRKDLLQALEQRPLGSDD